MFYTRGLHFRYYNKLYLIIQFKYKLEKKKLFCRLLFLMIKIGGWGKAPLGYFSGECVRYLA